MALIKPVAKKPARKRPATQKRLVPVAETKDLTIAKRARLVALLESMAELNQEREEIDEQYTALQTEAQALLDQLDKPTITTTTSQGKTVTGTLVKASRTVIDEVRLKKRLGAALWNAVTSTSLDRKKLDAAIKDGTVKASAVAECADLIPNKPFVKISIR